MSEERRRRRRDPWDDLFGSFSLDFDMMRQRMDELMDQFMRGELPQVSEPMIYGFSMRVGPDGRPRIQQFGNAIPPESPEEQGRREPLTDIIEEQDRVRVVVELPGVDKDDIQLHAEDRFLDIDVDREDRKFSKQLKLPCAVDPDSARATYKNGVLDITLARLPPKKRGRSIKIDSR
ncbi:MAG: Hsp20/alpha crystallin family protein [Euryarchaeota archaeon]|nr:Hsp20/alpha crystallin family protein [Euryarchaeota archaeon]